MCHVACHNVGGGGPKPKGPLNTAVYACGAVSLSISQGMDSGHAPHGIQKMCHRRRGTCERMCVCRSICKTDAGRGGRWGVRRIATGSGRFLLSSESKQHRPVCLQVRLFLSCFLPWRTGTSEYKSRECNRGWIGFRETVLRILQYHILLFYIEVGPVFY